ncbi:protein of unknown function (DUF4149) [Rubrobacter radiotolerans]|uniref:DUF4149 domain-containing protein n=1 Tax=Rubrobacter radiotolerans TaxID=42256 RepID=A0A023X1A8_RUBRA|nr:DUF4149 domain-containing protein [Rubrobacter radiotolerans]AHY45854.1 protein of unknown function (DUF4149) [Rubrobacter radiotolerans]MDX5893268.1 DUF4149 domain-containing protein [Rubrobacter radiotolerans]SMC03391.1 Uncharacterized membrane protein [Rubrobacter radiotolerans DSM 5868]
MEAFVHTVHVLLAGVWLGGLVFTTAVVSPALKAMKWSEAERVRVRAVIGGRYARVAVVNLLLLALFAGLDGAFGGFGGWRYLEYALILSVFALASVHGAYFGRRMTRLAEVETVAGGVEASEAAQKRRELQRVSLKLSVLALVLSAAIVALAANL